MTSWFRKALGLKEVPVPAPESITVEYDDAGDLRTIYTLPPTSSDLRSVFAFSLPKAGSVLLDSIMQGLSSTLGLTYVSIMGEYFNIGLRAQQFPESTSRIFLERGYCYGGFRFIPPRFEIPILKSAKSVLLVRDPRDMLVSHYFSTKTSHPAPSGTLKTGMKDVPLREVAQRLAIDEYVLDFAKFYLRHMSRYIEAIRQDQGNFRIYRYEDVIFNKRAWIADMCDAFDWPVPNSTINDIADRNDVIPSSEDQAKHIRQATPGDYKRKLQPETIERLTEMLAKELDYFGYNGAEAEVPPSPSFFKPDGGSQS